MESSKRPEAKMKRMGLGRGLDALLPATQPPRPQASAGASYGAGNVFTCPVDKLVPQSGQPRQRFADERLEELAHSIREHGLLEPLVVRRRKDDKLEIIAGERRWRASQRAGLKEVLVVVRDVSSADAFELALIENIQRADLNPIEEARAFFQLIELREYTQDQLAERVGKDRTTVSNALRLLRLPDRVQDLVREGRLSMGHARALLGLPHERDMNALATEVVRGKLSVRATERAVRKRASEVLSEEGGDDVSGADDETRRRKIIVGELEARLRRRLGVRVRLRPSNKKGAGSLEIPYQTLDELDRLLQVILGRET